MIKKIYLLLNIIITLRKFPLGFNLKISFLNKNYILTKITNSYFLVVSFVKFIKNNSLFLYFLVNYLKNNIFI